MFDKMFGGKKHDCRWYGRKTGYDFGQKRSKSTILGFLGGGDWSKVFRIYSFLNGIAYFDDGGWNAVDRLSLRFFVVRDKV